MLYVQQLPADIRPAFNISKWIGHSLTTKTEAFIQSLNLKLFTYHNSHNGQIDKAHFMTYYKFHAYQT